VYSLSGRQEPLADEFRPKWALTPVEHVNSIGPNTLHTTLQSTCTLNTTRGAVPAAPVLEEVRDDDRLAEERTAVVSCFTFR